MSETVKGKNVKEGKGGSFLHKDHIEWMLKDFANDERISWLFEKDTLPYLKFGGIALLCGYLVVGPGAQLISNLVGFTYPAYCSIRALESKAKEDDTRWLTYWVVFACFTLIDTFSGFVLSWLPFYWLAKVCFLCWCFMPSEMNGSDIIYKNVILPFFKKHENKIDKAMDQIETVVKKASDQTGKLIETQTVIL